MAEKGRNMQEVYHILYIIFSNYSTVTCLPVRNMANFKFQPPMPKFSNGLLSALTYCLLTEEPSSRAVIIIPNVFSL